MSKAYYSQEIIAEIRARADIVSIVSEYVNLRRSGRNYVGLCPFHLEKTPSFTVDPDKQLFYCFGCGVGGNVFTFLMKKENMTFPEAVEELAKRTGVSLPREKMSLLEERKRKERDQIFKTLEFAQEIFREMLLSREGSFAKKYLTGRGLSKETIEKFELGYAPGGWEFLVLRAKRAGFDLEYLHKAGLLIQRDRGGYYDRFRHRVTFPIRDSSSRLIGFAGRALGDENPKYLNSPDTIVFHKRRELYGLHLAKEGIRRTGKVCVMEGYMDVISSFQNGIDYAVAGMGTALSEEQARTVLLLAEDIILSYDQDEAGKRAARRSIDVFRRAGGRTRVLRFSGAKDPDEFLRSFGSAKFLEAVEQAVPDIRFIYEEAKKTYGVSSAEAKLKVKDAIVPVLASLDSEFEISVYVGEISRDLDVRKESLDKDVELYRQRLRKTLKYKKLEKSNTTGYGNQLKSGSNLKVRGTKDAAGIVGSQDETKEKVNLARIKAEEGIIRSLVEKPELLSWAQSNLSEKNLKDAKCRLMFSRLAEDPVAWMEEEELSNWVAELCARFGPVVQPERVLKDCVKKLKEIRLSELREEIVSAQREKDEKRLSSIIVDYQKLLKEVKSTGENITD